MEMILSVKILNSGNAGIELRSCRKTKVVLHSLTFSEGDFKAIVITIMRYCLLEILFRTGLYILGEVVQWESG